MIMLLFWDLSDSPEKYIHQLYSLLIKRILAFSIYCSTYKLCPPAYPDASFCAISPLRCRLTSSLSSVHSMLSNAEMSIWQACGMIFSCSNSNIGIIPWVCYMYVCCVIWYLASRFRMVIAVSILNIIFSPKWYQFKIGNYPI